MAVKHYGILRFAPRTFEVRLGELPGRLNEPVLAFEPDKSAAGAAPRFPITREFERNASLTCGFVEIEAELPEISQRAVCCHARVEGFEDGGEVGRAFRRNQREKPIDFLCAFAHVGAYRRNRAGEGCFGQHGYFSRRAMIF